MISNSKYKLQQLAVKKCYLKPMVFYESYSSIEQLHDRSFFWTNSLLLGSKKTCKFSDQS